MRMPSMISVVATGRRMNGPEMLTADSPAGRDDAEDRKSTRLNSSHQIISYAVFCLQKIAGVSARRWYTAGQLPGMSVAAFSWARGRFASGPEVVRMLSFKTLLSTSAAALLLATSEF